LQIPAFQKPHFGVQLESKGGPSRRDSSHFGHVSVKWFSLNPRANGS
jgi:hypothetical protein